ncbi:hypothetical protein GCM10008967_01730 [Bacillus carboniphilus]|uniref:DUF4367 domain-containing protein n=1 Tax=Bacillus carboniphilus TaxID=86663 RepID=A0ABN0VQQ0_9BACI
MYRHSDYVENKSPMKEGKYNYMKKFSLVLIGLLITVTLAACGTGGKLDKSQVLSKSIEASKSIESYSVEMNMDVDMMDMKQKISATGDLTHNPDTMHLNMSMGMEGMTLDMETYVNGEEAYMSMFGEWIKMNPEEMGLSDFDQLSQEEMEKLAQFEDKFEMTEEDGEYVLSLSGNDEAYNVLIEEYVLSSLGDFSGDPYMEEMLESISIQKLDLVIHIDKKTFFQTAQSFDIELEMVEEELTTPIKIKGEFTTSNLNKVEPIEIPTEVKENAVEDEMGLFSDSSMTVEDIQALVSYDVPEPAQLPEGFVFTDGYYDEEFESVTLNYDKDMDNWVMLSIYTPDFISMEELEGEAVTVQDSPGLYYEMDGYFSVTWEKDGLIIELGGVGSELTKEEMLTIAESVQ